MGIRRMAAIGALMWTAAAIIAWGVVVAIQAHVIAQVTFVVVLLLILYLLYRWVRWLWRHARG